MTTRVYVETTVVSYYCARPSRDVVIAGHQQATRDLWTKLTEDFEGFVSALVISEAGQGDPTQARCRLEAIEGFKVLESSSTAIDLAERIISAGGIPQEYPEDALHVALAAAGGLDFLVTWNFAHINNPFTRSSIRRVIEGEGYQSPEIVSPDELLGGDE